MGISTPGAAARREYERLHTDYQTHVLRERRLIGSLILRMQPDSQPGCVWERGASGMRIVGARLDKIEGIEVLHDRRIPGTRAAVGHIAVGPAGVYVVAAKLAGVVKHRSVTRHDRRLLVAGLDQTKFVAKMKTSVNAISRLLRETPIPVAAALCFVDAHWPAPTRPFVLDGTWVGWPEALPDLVRRAGLLDPEAMRAAAGMLDARLPHS